MSKLQTPPPGYHSVVPSLPVPDIAKAIEYYSRVFDAVPTVQLPAPDGKLVHAEIRIGDSVIMLGQENPAYGLCSPLSAGGPSMRIVLYVPDVDATYQRVLAAGGKSRMEPSNQFWGDRMGEVTDPFGYQWMLATPVEEVRPDEYPARLAEYLAKHGNGCGSARE